MRTESRWRPWTGLLLTLASIGCNGQTAAPPPAVAEGPAATATADSPSPAPAAAAPRAPGETWDAVTMSGAKVGYLHTVVSEIQRDGRPVLRIAATMQLQVNRFGDNASPQVETVTYETADGQILAFECRQELSGQPTTRAAEFDGQTAEMRVTVAGRTETQAIVLPEGTRGPLAVDESLAESPLLPGEERQLLVFDPSFGMVMHVGLRADKYQSTIVLGEKLRLLRVEVSQTLPDGQSMPSLLWMDEGGTPRKVAIAGMELVRTSRDDALRDPAGERFDLGLQTLVHLDPPEENPHAAKVMRYRVRLKEADPAEVFPEGATQQVRSIDERTAEITVRSLRPDDKLPSGFVAQPPTDDDSGPNAMLQSDDEGVRGLAEKAAAGETDPWTVAVALEGLVRRSITSRNFSTALASAAEVADTRAGDCTEHAVLLAALCRARNVPARVAVGLVYVESASAFGYHMWTEVYVANRWLPLDATLGRGGIGGGHLKLAHSNLRGGDAYSSFIPVVQVLGQVEVEAIED